MSNTWPNGFRQALNQTEHEACNATNYPGTKQLCSICEEPTERCEENAIYVDDEGPLCVRCYAQYYSPQ